MDDKHCAVYLHVKLFVRKCTAKESKTKTRKNLIPNSTVVFRVVAKYSCQTMMSPKINSTQSVAPNY